MHTGLLDIENERELEMLRVSAARKTSAITSAQMHTKVSRCLASLLPSAPPPSSPLAPLSPPLPSPPALTSPRRLPSPSPHQVGTHAAQGIKVSIRGHPGTTDPFTEMKTTGELQARCLLPSPARPCLLSLPPRVSGR